jgi:hypothetical protein
MSWAGCPARRHSGPSPVLMNALVDAAKIRPRRRGEYRGLGLQDHRNAVLQRDHARHVAVGVANEVERHPPTKNWVRARTLRW